MNHTLLDVGSFSEQFKLNFIDGERWKWIVQGLLATLEITAVALVIGIVIGIVVSAVRSSYDKNKETIDCIPCYCIDC